MSEENWSNLHARSLAGEGELINLLAERSMEAYARLCASMDEPTRELILKQLELKLESPGEELRGVTWLCGLSHLQILQSGVLKRYPDTRNLSQDGLWITWGRHRMDPRNDHERELNRSPRKRLEILERCEPGQVLALMLMLHSVLAERL